jgi:hypothetical protein
MKKNGEITNLLGIGIKGVIDDCIIRWHNWPIKWPNNKSVITTYLLTKENMSKFAVKSIVIQIKGQSRNLTIDFKEK